MAQYIQLQKNDIQRIANHYGLIVVDYKPIEGGASNSSYVLKTPQNRYVLTVFDEKTLAYVVKLGQLLLFLAKYDFTTTRLLLLPTEEVTLVYRQKPVMLKTYISGQVCQNIDDAMMRQVGAAMARLHQTPAPDFLPDRHPYGLHFFPEVISHNVNQAYDSWLAERLVQLKLQIPPELPCGLIHGDIFYDNILFERGRLKAIIDFEEACLYYKMFDLGMGILGLCTEGTTWILSKARALVMGYQQVKALEEREKESLQLFCAYAAIATSCWRFWKYHIHSPTVEKADEHWQMVHLAEEIDAVPKTKFLETVFNSNG